MVAGGPGTGKSVLALQSLFHHSRRGKKALHLTAVSEPAIKLSRHMQPFGFFDQSLLDDRVFFHDLGSLARAEGIDRALETAIEQIDAYQPDPVAFDSFRPSTTWCPTRTRPGPSCTISRSI